MAPSCLSLIHSASPYLSAFHLTYLLLSSSPSLSPHLPPCPLISLSSPLPPCLLLLLFSSYSFLFFTPPSYPRLFLLVSLSLSPPYPLSSAHLLSPCLSLLPCFLLLFLLISSSFSSSSPSSPPCLSPYPRFPLPLPVSSSFSLSPLLPPSPCVSFLLSRRRHVITRHERDGGACYSSDIGVKGREEGGEGNRGKGEEKRRGGGGRRWGRGEERRQRRGGGKRGG